ncbi:MAG TPA: ion transporter [Hyphomonadaceae bacterium]|jgi:voltage-gated potassium channel
MVVAHQVAVQFGLRHRLYREMEPSARDRPGLSRANTAIVALVLLSFLLFALETEPLIQGDARVWLSLLNFVVLGAFAVEYVLRIWIAGENPSHKGTAGRLRYIFSPYALADLAAFLPELIWLMFPHNGDDSMLMFLRVLRLVRLLKIARFIPAFEVLGAALKRAGSQLLTALAVALALVFIAAVLLYFIEGVGQGRSDFASIPRSIWWAIATLTTVGYGDIFPTTVGGKIAASIIAFAGIGVVALPTGIFASAFSDELREREKRRMRNVAAKSENVSELPAAAGQPSSD